MILFLFAGCGESGPVTFTPAGVFTSAFTMRQDDHSFSGEVACRGADDITLTFSEPAGVRGVEVRYVPGGLTVTVGDKTETVCEGELPGGAPIELLLAGLRQFCFCEQRADKNENGTSESSGTVGGVLLTAVYDETGRLCSVSDNNGFAAAFIAAGTD